MSREEKFRRKGKAKIKNLKPKDYEDGYYVDEFGEKQKQEKRAKEIRAQEREVIRRRKKSLTSTQIKHRRIALYSSIFAAVLIIGVILSLTVLFKTEKIEVVGDKYYDEKQIIAFSGVEYQENIFMGAMYNTSDKIVKNLSYIESASVSFNIPDTITITVVDATIVQKYIVNMAHLDNVNQKLADVDVDAVITIKDATAVQKYIVNVDGYGKTGEKFAAT